MPEINTRYFFNKTGDLILSEDLDTQFNKLAKYINKNVIPTVDSIQFNITKGVAGEKDSVFCNINDKDVGYVYINDINIDDNLISLNKLVTSEPGAIFCTDQYGDIFPNYPTADNQLLFSNDSWFDDLSESMVFRKINADDLSNNSINGNKLEALAIENFVDGFAIGLIPDNSIGENNLKNVTNDKIAIGAVEFRHIGIWSGLDWNEEIASKLLLDDFDDNSVTTDKISNGSISFDLFIDREFIESHNIADRSITNAHFLPYNANDQPPAVIANMENSRFAAIINFPEIEPLYNFKLTSDKIALNSIGYQNLSMQARAAVDEYVAIKERAKNPPVQPKPLHVVSTGSYFEIGYGYSFGLTSRYGPYLIKVAPWYYSDGTTKYRYEAFVDGHWIHNVTNLSYHKSPLYEIHKYWKIEDFASAQQRSQYPPVP